ncbi:MAG: hypothetical protein JKY96_03545, partial [Phycisphaerales bacterium]|nr:hypothetical protein [Phycisphaerales bacterium]
RLAETGWWGEGLDKAVDYVNSAAPDGATWASNSAVTHTFDALRGDLVHQETLPEFFIDADLSPVTEQRPGYLPHYQVDAGGAPIVIVFRKR